MRVFFATVFLLFSLLAYTQTDTTRRADTAIKLPPTTSPEFDSAFVKTQRQLDSVIRAMSGKEDPLKDEEMELTENNIKNIQSIMHIRQEAEERKGRRAQMQIALGVLFFILLVVGMLRRRRR
jgi:hypothetical protein